MNHRGASHDQIDRDRLRPSLATTAQAAPSAPLTQPEGLFTQVREACGAGMHRVGGVCVRTPARRAAARCAAGLRWVNGRCIR